MVGIDTVGDRRRLERQSRSPVSSGRHAQKSLNRGLREVCRWATTTIDAVLAARIAYQGGR
ncbi:MAG: hypothetical protein ACRCYU_18070 [Nocardioides sp.]